MKFYGDPKKEEIAFAQTYFAIQNLTGKNIEQIAKLLTPNLITKTKTVYIKKRKLQYTIRIWMLKQLSKKLY
jgi:hypothetical protein